MPETAKTTCDVATDRLVAACADPAYLAATAALLRRLTPDALVGHVASWLEVGALTGDRRGDVRSVLRAIASERRPQRYLEIGVRRGWSLAQVLDACATIDAVGIDCWTPGYAGTDNPGPAFVLMELGRVLPTFTGTLELHSGNSHDLLPELIADGAAFDLICVDGDHTALGAWWDLMDALALLAPGGVLVMDDLVTFADPGPVPTSVQERPAPPWTEPVSLRNVWEWATRGRTAWVVAGSAPPVGVMV